MRHLLLSLVLLPLVWSAASGMVLVRNGQPAAGIVLREAPDEYEKQAADELQSYIHRISGARLPICTEAALPAGLRPILIDLYQADSEFAKLAAQRPGRTGFGLWIQPVATQLVGYTPESTLFAAYEVLERLGVRWFMPGDLGTVVPRSANVVLPDTGQVIDSQWASFEGRWHNGGVYFKEWGKHVRMGGPFFPSSHGIPLGRSNTFAAHPEYFSLIGGERKEEQLCVSNPEVIRLATEQVREYFRAHPDQPWLGMGPNDGSGFCECEACRALDGGDWDPFSNEPGMTDRYVWFFNQILKGLADEFPTKKIGFYAYHSYMRPPVKVKPDPRLVPALAVIALCRMHGPDNPVCPEKSYWIWLAREWKKVVPEVYDRGYWFNLADPGFPFSELHRLRKEIPLGRELGLAGWRVETANHWGSETPTLYIAAKLMWDADASVDALRDDFCRHFFGPVAPPMRQYLNLMDVAVRDADHHTGSSWDLPLVYPDALRKRAAALLAQAAKAAPVGVVAERVKLFQTSFASLQAFVRMCEARDKLQFERANTELQALRACHQTLLAYDPPMVHPRMAEPYLKRLFAPCVEQGHARTTGGNRLVAGFSDTWEFQLDPQRIGEDTGLWRADCHGGNWQRLKSSLSWSNQGLRTYKGECWYRQSFTVPASEVGRRLFLWFGGVDEKAKVWVNGQPMGISPGASFMPFELDATGAVKAGANVLTIRLANTTVNELGTGGLVAPVLLYAPREGAAAQLENLVPPGRTFP